MRYGVLLVVVVLLVGCGLPRDPAGTLARVEASSLRVGLVSNPPWADFSDGEPTGIEVELVNQLASELGTDVQWRPGLKPTCSRPLRSARSIWSSAV
jgi:polar amino acid transport system substrate-binding protein